MLLCYFYKKAGDDKCYGHAIVIKGYDGTDADGSYRLITYDSKYPNEDRIMNVEADYSTCVINAETKQYPYEIELTSDFSAFDLIDIDGPDNDMNFERFADKQSGYGSGTDSPC